jgi:hypothetical protein
MGDNHKNVKMGWGHLKIFFRTTGPISSKLCSNHSRLEGIQVCSNEGECSSPRGDNRKRVKALKLFKKSSPELEDQIQ